MRTREEVLKNLMNGLLLNPTQREVLRPEIVIQTELLLDIRELLQKTDSRGL